MNDFKITLNKRQQHFLSRLLPKGYSFQQYKVRKNINDYPYKQYDKKYKKTQSIILSKKQSIVMDSLQVSQKSFRQKSQVPSIIFRQQLFTPLQCDLLQLVRKLRKHQSSYPFRSPVDPKALQIPDYFDVVLQPIDLKTIQQQIRQNQYTHISQFERDIYKMIMNSYKFNQKSTSTYNKTIQFEVVFVEMMREHYLKERGNNSNSRENNNRENNSREQNFIGGQKDLVKEEMIDSSNPGIDLINDQTQNKLDNFKIWNSKENQHHSVSGQQNNCTLAQSMTISQKQKKQPKLLKVLTQMAEERIRISKKKLPKLQSISNNNSQNNSKTNEKSIIESLTPPLPKKQELSASQQQQHQQEQQQLSLPFQEQIFCLSQPNYQPSQSLVKNQQQSQQQQNQKQQQFIDQQMGQFLQNQTVKDQNCSQGYNQFISGNKIRNIQVQKQITTLLKKLNQYPLTKQKKNKLFSKFNNLDQNMTQGDKKKLFDKINKLDQNDIQYVIRILMKNKQDLIRNDEFQIDLDKADSKVLREIQNFIAIRDNSIISPNQNSFLSMGFPQSLDLISQQSKKVKKQEKKLLKKKLSRKNSNDDSFSINLPQIKKKKSQKPIKKLTKDQQSLNNQDEVNSINDQKSQSSYHPQPTHHGKISISQQLQKNNQNDKASQQQKQKQKPKPKPPTNQNQQQSKPFPSQQPLVQKFDPSQIFITPPQSSHHHHHQPYQSRQIYDIDQFLVSSKHLNDPQSSPQHGGPFTSGRKKRKSIDPLDLMYDNNFHFENSGIKDFTEEEILREYSIDEVRKQHNNDDDQFF